MDYGLLGTVLSYDYYYIGQLKCNKCKIVGYHSLIYINKNPDCELPQ